MHNPETLADNAGIFKKTLDARRGCIRYNVKIFRNCAAEEIAHGAADDIGGISRITKPRNNVFGIAVNLRAANAVFFLRIYHRLFDRTPIFVSTISK